MNVGIDEVGRGCWAGPLVAAAVALASTAKIPGLDDSKKLSVIRREQLDQEIRLTTNHIGIGWVWPEEINQFGLTESIKLAMQRAYDELSVDTAEIIIDGSINYLAHIPNTVAIIKADGSVPVVSAASIIAKVARDNYMSEIAFKYPDYGFEKHVGYGTKMHIKALKEYGILPIHRTSYKPIQALLQSGAA